MRSASNGELNTDKPSVGTAIIRLFNLFFSMRCVIQVIVAISTMSDPALALTPSYSAPYTFIRLLRPHQDSSSYVHSNFLPISKWQKDAWFGASWAIHSVTGDHSGNKKRNKQNSESLEGGMETGLANAKSEADDLYFERFRRRLQDIRDRRVPNPLLDACEFVMEILNTLREKGSGEDYSSNPDNEFFGPRVLLRASTPKWRTIIRKSVGLPPDAPTNTIASALLQDLRRRDNQFNLLLGIDHDRADDSEEGEGEEYTISFPNDPVDYGDGKCWIECRLRGSRNDDLLVVMGWSLEKRTEDGAWLVCNIDWQDFRGDFRPGIGREEWERICG